MKTEKQIGILMNRVCAEYVLVTMLIDLIMGWGFLMLEFLFELLSDMVGVSTGALNTRKIDDHIELLKQESWFKKIYGVEKYRRLFVTNRNVRAYLQSTYRVQRIIRSNDAQRKLLLFLDEQFKSHKKR